MGVEVEAMAQVYGGGTVSAEAAAKRRERDGEPHHITVASKPEMASLSAEQVEKLTVAAAGLQRLSSPPHSLKSRRPARHPSDRPASEC